MFVEGIEYWGLNLVVTMVAAYAVVLVVALAVGELRRLVGPRKEGDTHSTRRRHLASEPDSAAR
jgi:hypothetical protein